MCPASYSADWQAVVAEQGAFICRKVSRCQRRCHGVCGHDIGAVVSAGGLRHAGPLSTDKAGQVEVGRRQRRHGGAVIGLGRIANNGGGQCRFTDCPAPEALTGKL